MTRIQICHESSLPGLHGSFWTLFSLERLVRHHCLQENTLNASLLRKESLLDGFLCSKLCRKRPIEMCSFCFLTLMELIPIPNCSILYSYSNEMITRQNSWHWQFNHQIRLICCFYYYIYTHRYCNCHSSWRGWLAGWQLMSVATCNTQHVQHYFHHRRKGDL